MLVTEYSKTQKRKRNSNPICRFLPQELALCLAQYLSYIRPIEPHFIL